MTADMDAVYRLSRQMADPHSDTLAYYIHDSEVPVALEGDLPPLQRTFILKVNKKLKDRAVRSRDFAQLKQVIRHQNRQILDTVRVKFPNYAREISRGVSKEFNTDFAFSISQVIPLDPHYDSDNAIAYSMYINDDLAIGGDKEKTILAATVTLLNAAARLLLLYCYAPKHELEWTRTASRSWADEILKANSSPPRCTGVSRFGWRQVGEKAVIGAIAGGLIAMVLSLLARFGIGKKEG